MDTETWPTHVHAPTTTGAKARRHQSLPSRRGQDLQIRIVDPLRNEILSTGTGHRAVGQPKASATVGATALDPVSLELY